MTSLPPPQFILDEINRIRNGITKKDYLPEPLPPLLHLYCPSRDESSPDWMSCNVVEMRLEDSFCDIVRSIAQQVSATAVILIEECSHLVCSDSDEMEQIKRVGVEAMDESEDGLAITACTPGHNTWFCVFRLQRNPIRVADKPAISLSFCETHPELNLCFSLCDPPAKDVPVSALEMTPKQYRSICKMFGAHTLGPHTRLLNWFSDPPPFGTNCSVANYLNLGVSEEFVRELLDDGLRVEHFAESVAQHLDCDLSVLQGSEGADRYALTTRLVLTTLSTGVR